MSAQPHLKFSGFYLELLLIAGALVAQWVKRWPTDLGVVSSSPLKVISSQP